MALRCQKATCGFFRIATLLLLLMGPVGNAAAQNYTFEARHRHWHGGSKGVLHISPVLIAFEEKGKGAKTHSREWRYEEIQQLTLARNELRILTYEDSNWKFGRDREYAFDHLPQGLAPQVYPLFASSLDQRFIAALPDLRTSPEWKTGAKLTQGIHGTRGILLLARDQIVFDARKRDDSRTWRLSDIENVSSSGRFDFTLITMEKSGLFRESMRQFHFQLETALTETQFDHLWHAINQRKGLRFLDPERDQRASTRSGTVP
jgi:hypothetical protein